MLIVLSRWLSFGLFIYLVLLFIFSRKAKQTNQANKPFNEHLSPTCMQESIWLKRWSFQHTKFREIWLKVKWQCKILNGLFKERACINILTVKFCYAQTKKNYFIKLKFDLTSSENHNILNSGLYYKITIATNLLLHTTLTVN